MTPRGCIRQCSSVFVDAGISVTVIALTDGEKGFPQSASWRERRRARNTRRTEQQESLRSLGATAFFLGLPDLGLMLLSRRKETKAIRKLTKYVRQKNPGAIVSFNPHSITPLFDHPDHVVAGKWAQLVGAGSDVRNFFRRSGAPTKTRPELYLHTFYDFSPYDKDLYVLPIDETVKEWRNNHLKTHFPSQFSVDNENQWIVLFDRITDHPTLSQGMVWDCRWGVTSGEVTGIEIYKKVR